MHKGIVPKQLLPIAECSLDDWSKVINVNLAGVFNCLKYELANIEDGGSIVNMASAGGLYGAQNFSAYIASKHGVVGLSRSAAIEAAPRGIRVNAVCP
jgi:NAD(P)-dependent dehydrogenase (short-subunit alcohol dehydrogenase family)